MKTGRSIIELATEIETRANQKRDFIVPSNQIAMHGNAVFFGERSARISDLAHDQIATFTKIPRAYYRRCQSAQAHLGNNLLADQVNHWLKRIGDKGRMMRTLETPKSDDLRAFLSDMYLRVENEECLQAILPAIHRAKHLEIKSCEVTDRNMYVSVIDPSSERNISTATVGDTVSMGFIFRNSEVGLGFLETFPFIYRSVCKNGAVVNNLKGEFAVRRQHRGARLQADDSYIIQSDRTRKLRLDLIISEITDAVEAYCKPGAFEEMFERLQAAAKTAEVRSAASAVQEVAKVVSLPKGSLASIAERLVSDHDMTQYGMMQAITAEAHGASSYEANIEWQRAGGRVLDLKPRQWQRIAEADYLEAA